MMLLTHLHGPVKTRLTESQVEKGHSESKERTTCLGFTIQKLASLQPLKCSNVQTRSMLEKVRQRF